MWYECFLKARNKIVDRFVGSYKSLKRAEYHSHEILKALQSENKDISYFIEIRDSRDYSVRIVREVKL